MALLDEFFDTPAQVRDTEAVSELIRRRRRQMMVHAYLYYRMDSPIISDDLWQHMADDLERLQKENPDLMQQGVYDKEFKDWTGVTGMHLPSTGYERSLAEYLLRISQ